MPPQGVVNMARTGAMRAARHDQHPRRVDRRQREVPGRTVNVHQRAEMAQ
jgi:hypothetical protein